MLFREIKIEMKQCSTLLSSFPNASLTDAALLWRISSSCFKSAKASKRIHLQGIHVDISQNNTSSGETYFEFKSEIPQYLGTPGGMLSTATPFLRLSNTSIIEYLFEPALHRSSDGASSASAFCREDITKKRLVCWLLIFSNSVSSFLFYSVGYDDQSINHLFGCLMILQSSHEPSYLLQDGAYWVILLVKV